MRALADGLPPCEKKRPMSPIRHIITHPGGAHKDEFLACCVLIATHGAPVFRREPEAGDLEDPAVAVVDVGHRHEPDRNNFDHHQLPKDHPPVCSLSLVLDRLGLYEDARRFCDWLEPAEWFDCRGPLATARWLGVQREVVDRLNSPIDVTLLRRFARETRLGAGDPLWEIMRMIGEDLTAFVRLLQTRLEFLDHHAEVWTIEPAAESRRVVFVPRTDPLPEEPSLGLEHFVTGRGLAVDGLVIPDRRGGGYGLSRFQDSPRFDFGRLADHPEVHFAHARGFLAKTSATDPAALRALLERAAV